MGRGRWRLAALGIAILVGGLFAGCGSSDSDDNQSGFDPLCALSEAREGSPYIKWEGLSLATVEEAAARQGLSVFRRFDADRPEPAGTVVKISICGASERTLVAVIAGTVEGRESSR